MNAEVDRGPVAPAYRWDLDVLRILAILGVVSIHIFGLVLGDVRLHGTATWWFGLLLTKLVIFCVPVFVMISGALLLDPAAHRRGAADFYRRRVQRLLPGLVFWHVFYFVVVRGVILEQEIGPELALVNLLDVNVYTALYFFWVILGLYLVAPPLAAFIQGSAGRARSVALVCMTWSAVLLSSYAVLALLGYPRGRWENIWTQWLPFVGLFVAGYAWRDARLTGRRWLWAGAGALVTLGFIAWQYSRIPEPAWLQALLPISFTAPLTALASILLFVCVVDLCARREPGPRSRGVLRALAEATFGVFVCHLLFLALFRRFTPDFYADPAPATRTLLYLAVLGAAWVTALLARRVPYVSRLF